MNKKTLVILLIFSICLFAIGCETEEEDFSDYDYNGENFAINYPGEDDWNIETQHEEYEVFEARYDIDVSDDYEGNHIYHKVEISYNDSGSTMTENEFINEDVVIRKNWMNGHYLGEGNEVSYHLGDIAYEFEINFEMEKFTTAYFRQINFYKGDRLHYINFYSQGFDDIEDVKELSEIMFDNLEVK